MLIFSTEFDKYARQKEKLPDGGKSCQKKLHLNSGHIRHNSTNVPKRDENLLNGLFWPCPALLPCAWKRYREFANFHKDQQGKVKSGRILLVFRSIVSRFVFSSENCIQCL